MRHRVLRSKALQMSKFEGVYILFVKRMSDQENKNIVRCFDIDSVTYQQTLEKFRMFLFSFILELSLF